MPRRSSSPKSAKRKKSFRFVAKKSRSSVQRRSGASLKNYLRQLGENIRAARLRGGLTLRLLAEESSLCVRFHAGPHPPNQQKEKNRFGSSRRNLVPPCNAVPAHP